MSRLLKDGERLVRDGITDLRAPDGTPLQNVPIYRIAGPNEQVTVAEPMAAGERLVECGFIAERGADGNFCVKIPLYEKVKKSDIKKSGLTKKQEEDCDFFVVTTMAEMFGDYVNAMEALGNGNDQSKGDAST